MRRWLPVVALGLAVAMLAIVAVLILRPTGDDTPAARSEAIASQLRCPDCQGLSVADSPSAAAREIRRQVDELIASGASDDAIRAHFVSRYGEWVLLAPVSPLLWAVPIFVVLAGAATLAAWLLRRRPADVDVDDELSERDRDRVREQAEALDA